MSKLATALAAVAPRRKGPACSVKQLLAQLEPSERAALESAISDTSENRPTGKALSIAIESAYDAQIHRASIERHRRGDCLCSREAR
jgi:hypothetical protein